MPFNAEPDAQHFYLKRGQDIPISFKFPVAPGSLVGKTFKIGVKRTMGETISYLFEKTLTVTDTNPDDDEIMASADTDAANWNLSPGVYYFDVWCTTDAQEAVYAFGTITIESTPRK